MSYIPNIFRLNPSARTVVDIVDQAVAINAAFGGTSGQLSLGAAAVGGMALWNPAYNTLLTFTGSPTTVTLTLGYKQRGAAPVSAAPAAFVYNGSNTAASLQTYLLTIPGVPGTITVSGNNGGPYTINYVSSGPIDALAPPVQIVGYPVFVGGASPRVLVAPPVLVWVYGYSYSDDTGGTLVRFEYVTTNPALGTAATGLSKFFRGAATTDGGLLHFPNAVLSSAVSGITPGANVTDAIISIKGGLTAQAQPVDHCLLQPGTGVLLSATNAGAIKAAINFDWVEMSTAEW